MFAQTWVVGPLVALLFATSAKAEIIPFSENSSWRVSYDTSTEFCIARPTTPEGIHIYQKNAKQLALILSGPKLSWVQADRSYPTIVRTDRRRWNGTLTGFQSPEASGLAIFDPADDFLKAIRAASTISLEADGAAYGPYPLTGSNQTFASLESCLKRRDSGGFAPEAPIYVPLNKTLSWSTEHIGKTFSFGKMTGTIEHQANRDGTGTTYLRISEGSKQIGILKAEGTAEGGSGEIGTFNFSGGEPSIVFTSFTGGAHCCTESWIGKVSGSIIHPVSIGTHDGDGPSFEDIDGDGDFEIITSDQRFLYAFGPYASSMPPVIISRLIGDELRVVTRNPELQPFVRSRFVRSINRVQGQGDETSDGQVAGLLATAADLGIYDIVRGYLGEKTMRKKPEQVCYPPDCQPEREFQTLEQAIAYRFEKWGINHSFEIAQTARETFERLARTKGFGKAAGGSDEASCGGIPYKFSVESNGILAMSGYEFQCKFQQAKSMGPTIMASGLCDGDGEFWTTNLLLQLDGSGLLMTEWSNDFSAVMSSSLAVEAIPECR